MKYPKEALSAPKSISHIQPTCQLKVEMKNVYKTRSIKMLVLGTVSMLSLVLG